MEIPKYAWKAGEFGDKDHALYIGRLYVGEIMLLHHNQKWRAWFMNDPEGNQVGQYDTPEEARAAVEEALETALR